MSSIKSQKCNRVLEEQFYFCCACLSEKQTQEIPNVLKDFPEQVRLHDVGIILIFVLDLTTVDDLYN